MTEKKREPKVIHVDKLIVHAKEVEIIHDRKRPVNPWFFGQQREMNENVEGEQVEEEHDEHHEENHEEPENNEQEERRRPFWM